MTERLRAAFATGRWAIDRWEADYRHEVEALRDDVLYVRPAVQGREEIGRVFDRLEPSFDDEDLISRMARRMYPPSYPCTFHGAAGCVLALDERPIECRSLEPRTGPIGDCVPRAGGQEERAVEWAPYQDLLREVAGG